MENPADKVDWGGRAEGLVRDTECLLTRFPIAFQSCAGEVDLRCGKAILSDWFRSTGIYPGSHQKLSFEQAKKAVEQFMDEQLEVAQRLLNCLVELAKDNLTFRDLNATNGPKYCDIIFGRIRVVGSNNQMYDLDLDEMHFSIGYPAKPLDEYSVPFLDQFGHPYWGSLLEAEDLLYLESFINTLPIYVGIHKEKQAKAASSQKQD